MFFGHYYAISNFFTQTIRYNVDSVKVQLHVGHTQNLQTNLFVITQMLTWMLYIDVHSQERLFMLSMKSVNTSRAGLTAFNKLTDKERAPFL